MAVRCLCGIAGLLGLLIVNVLSTGAVGQESSRVVAFANGGSIGTAVLANGDVFLLPNEANTWSHRANIFAASGAAGGREIVGMIGPTLLTVLADDGTTFLGRNMGAEWTIGPNIWESSGQSPDGDPFVALGWLEACGGGYAYAATASGKTFRRAVGSSIAPWEYTGNIAGGATPSTLQTWGGIKERYRR